MPFRQTVWWAEGFVGKHILTKVQFNSNKCIYFKISSFLCQRKEKWQILFWKCFDMKYFNFYVQSLRGEKSVFQSCNAIFVNKFHYFAVECLKWRPRGIKSLHSGQYSFWTTPNIKNILGNNQDFFPFTSDFFLDMNGNRLLLVPMGGVLCPKLLS